MRNVLLKEDERKREAMKALRTLLLIVCVPLVAAVVACNDSPPPTPSSQQASSEIVPSPTPPVDQPTPAPPIDVPLEVTLGSVDLTKFRNLPGEFQNALREEAAENGLDSALASLRALPDDAPPIADLLTEEDLAKFEELDEPRQRQVLLEGYPNASRKWNSPEPIEGDPRFSELGRAVDAAHFYLYSGDELRPLPPYDEALSAEALSKLESLDPLMQYSFRMWWATERHGPWNMDAAIANLEEALLAAPAELPDIRELGLSAEALAVLEDLPQLEDFVWQYVAFVLVSRGDIEPNMRERLDNELRLFAADDGPEFLARGWMPGQPHMDSPPYPLICAWGASTGIWPDWAVPEYFRDLEPNQLVLFKPDPEVVLSPEALKVLYSLDQPLRDRISFLWYGSGISPSNARNMACTVMQDDLNLRYIPFTSMPPIEDLLSPESRRLFASMSESRQNIFRTVLATNIVRGRVQPPPEHGPVVYAYGSSPEEFLAALGLWLDAEIAKAPAAPEPPSSTAIPPTPTPMSLEGSLSGHDLAKFNGLPEEFQNALREEATENGSEVATQYLHDLPDDAVPIADLLDSWGLDLFDQFDSPYQRMLLLEGYPNSTMTWYEDKWRAGEITDLKYRFGAFEGMVNTLWREVAWDGVEHLPPLEDTLSSAALAKLDSVDPIIRRAFRLMWESRTGSLNEVARQATLLEEDLLATPNDMPTLEDMGLSVEVVKALDDLPDLRVLAQQMVAGLLVSRHEWGPDESASIEQRLAPFSTPDGKAAFVRGLIPRQDDTVEPLVCHPSYWQGFGVSLPTWAIPEFFRDIPPDKMMFRWPDLADGLSSEALDKLESLDPSLRQLFMDSWYGRGDLPKQAEQMACQVAKSERGLLDAPFTTLPSLEEILSPDALELYGELAPYWQDMITSGIGANILSGEVWIIGESPKDIQIVSSYGTPPSEFLKALGVSADYMIRRYVCHTDSEGNYIKDAVCDPPPSEDAPQ